MSIRRTQVTATAAGSAGSATGTALTPVIVHGMVRAIHLDYSAGAAATTDVSIAEANETPAISVLAVANNVTDGWYYPARAANNSADGSALSGAAVPLVCADTLAVVIAQANAGNSVTATIIWDDGLL